MDSKIPGSSTGSGEATKINRSFFQCYDLARLIECCCVCLFRSEERLKAIAFLESDSTCCSVPSERSAITQMKDGQRRK